MFADAQVKAILVNVFGGIVNCAIIANGIVNATQRLKLTVPLIVRLEGKHCFYYIYLFCMLLKINKIIFCFVVNCLYIVDIN